MEVGLVRRIDIDEEMQQSYLDYAMSVIVARALPDARDGLKPVHRRILYAMYAMGIRPDSGYKKSARIVGEVLGKYHPHGDMAVYDAMVRMAQDFSMRYQLIEGQGNFGSIDGDPPAAMRYTEARMSPLAMEMLSDLDRDTVGFVDNFDGSLQEPIVLPAAIPNLLINGATGIAVGMATSIPPHNMKEICDALIYMLRNWSRMEKISLEDLMNFIQGPDFPTGGIILQRKKDEGEGLIAAYASGKGKITLQAKAHLEEMGRGRSRIIITELPFQTNKSNLVERIAELVRTGLLEGITDLRDESDRQGMRIVIELSKTAEPEKVLTELYRRTPMQSTFSMIMLALVDSEPRLLNLKQALRVYLEHRIEVTGRRSRFELDRARKRAHILEGLRIALKNLDEVISLIRNAQDADQARQRLMRRFKLTQLQADAILEMPLRRLSNLERKKIELEYKETLAHIRELETLLQSEAKMRSLIADELAQVSSTYADPRRTHVVRSRADGKQMAMPLTATDVAVAKETWVVVSQEGLISRTPSARLPRLSGRTPPKLVIGATGRDALYLFERNGIAAAFAVHTLPECDDPAQGTPLSSVSPFSGEVELVAGIAVAPDLASRSAEERYIVFATEQGMVKKTPLQAFPGPLAKVFQAVKVPENDALGWARLSEGQDEIVLVSRKGYAIRFHESEVRSMGLIATGVMGMKLDDPDDKIIGMDLIRPRSELFQLSGQGLAKRTPLHQYPLQGRYGKGVLTWKSGAEVSLAGATIGKSDERAIVHLSKGVSRSIRIGDAIRRPRAAAGEALISLREGERVIGLTSIMYQRESISKGETNSSEKSSFDGKSSTGRKSRAKASASGKSSSKKTASKTSSRSKKSSSATAARKGRRSRPKRKSTPKGAV
jgi:DNA gyrase subunit A